MASPHCCAPSQDAEKFSDVTHEQYEFLVNGEVLRLSGADVAQLCADHELAKELEQRDERLK